MPSAASSTGAITREDVRFRSGDAECAAWLYPPPGADGAPCVVMAHGFAALKEGRLDAYADRFNAAGYGALVFDYRHFGESGGEPRDLISLRRQHEDWRAAVDFARGLEGVDAERMVPWGSSLSGGHVIWLAARDERLRAAISQVPHTNGIATLREVEPKRLLGLTAHGLLDQAGALFGRAPHYVPSVGPPGSMAAMTGDDAESGYAAMYPDGFDWGNRAAARILLTLALYSPGRDAAKIRCPILFQVGTEDHITPPKPTIAAAERAPRGELITYPLRHFDIYRGEAFERAVADQLEFLGRHLG
jgi:fermentation-respiration switch protein FrsA (DUF1100 family)